ncbi:CDC42 protein [Paramicrosporidium saccamoebae]|uniref:CDC42 protein n=1 Tax=Paramicrosporidium saccamoebae TaxID=1246581 RepID=A0A2H9TFT7_9FUNG|nr:CDC42 protein [Paramicrosporidium saccamoebae]
MPGVVDINTVKCVVIGDGAVGKGDFPRDYVPTVTFRLVSSLIAKVFDNYAVTVEVGGQKITLHLLDTAGTRPTQFAHCVVFLLCYAVTNRTSMENIRDKWYPELRRYSPGIPFILVGTQVDRRPAGASTGTGSNQSFVSQSEGLKMAKELGAVSHIECSALTREGIREVFVNAILAALDPKKAKASGNSGKSKKCLIV